ncbi:MAG: group III truncated hemoglobin [Bacteroidota bacterium]
MQLLNSRAAVSLLIHTFYSRVRKDELIGPIFNDQIKDWDAHLERLTDFWETNLLFVRRYKGNPIQAHIEVDQNHEIISEHFGRWLQLWYETIDAYFEGDNAHVAKNRARNMSTHLFMKIYAARTA